MGRHDVETEDDFFAAPAKLERSDVPAARSLLRRAVDLLGTDDPFRIELLPDLALSVQDERSPVWEEAVERATASGDERLLAHAVVQRSRWVGLRGRDLGEAEREADDAMRVFERVGDPLGLSRAWALKGAIAFERGRVAEEDETIPHALRYAKQAGSRREEADILAAVGRDVVRGPTHVDAGIRRCEDILATYAGDATIEAFMFHPLGHLWARRGEFDRARGFVTRLRRFFHETGQPYDEAFFCEVAGDVEIVAGDAPAAADVLREGWEELQRLGQPAPIIAAFLARALIACERPDEAESLLATVVDEDDVLTRPLARGGLARVRAWQRRFDEARSLAEEAVGLLASTDYLIDRADTMLDLAAVLRAAGRPEEARERLQDAIALFERKGDRVTPDRLRATLRT